MTEPLPWFAARLLFEASAADGDEEPLFEERVLLVKSPEGLEAACRKAEDLGNAGSDCYENPEGETVAWVFKEVLEVVQLNEAAIGDGSEVYHRYLSSADLQSVRNLLKAS